MGRLLIPQPSHYAVIRLDPEAMVEDLGLQDTKTLLEVRNMSRKKYLVFLEWVGIIETSDSCESIAD